jgi:TolB-like protein/tetratricopeptide (TPR) repeat protein
MSLVSELKRRNVFRVALAYLAVAWLLIQVAETTFPLFGLPDSAARLVVVVLGIGAIPALVFSWVFELTPDGIKKESEVNRDQSITAATGRSIDRIVIAVLALAVVYFAFDKFVLSEVRVESARQEGRSQGLVESYGDKSIAVLPFVDMSSGRDQEYMSDGIAEELLNLLTQIPRLRVISRSSSFSFKAMDIDIPSIAEKLDVAYILEGSVRKSGNRIRITSQLVEARSDTHVWSETYERELNDIFAIQDGIAKAVVDKLEMMLMGEPPKVPETDPEAYALFLQARHLHENPSTGAFHKALEAYQAALAIDDKYVPAWTWLAALYDDMAHSLGLPYEEVGRLARGAIRRALAIDPDDPMALGMSAIIIREWDHDLVLAASQMQRGVALDPNNPVLLRWAGLLMPALGQYDEAVRVSEFLFERDPVGVISKINLSTSYLNAARFDDAIETSKMLLMARPDSGIGHFQLALAYLHKGDMDLALEQTEQRGDSVRLTALAAIALHGLDRIDEFDSTLAELREWYDSGRLTIANRIALVYAFIGDADAAFEWLERALHDGVLGLSPADADFVNLHDDPRWNAMMEKAGFSQETLDAIKIEVKLPK